MMKLEHTTHKMVVIVPSGEVFMIKLEHTTHEVTIQTPSEEVFNVVKEDLIIIEVIIVIEVLHNQQEVHIILNSIIIEDLPNQ